MLTADAVGCSAAKLPYLKGYFTLEGIPHDIPWLKKDGRIKKPTDYGQSQINEIFKNFQSQINENETFVDFQEEISASLLEIVTSDIAARAFNGGDKIKASEVNFLVSLRDKEKEELKTKYFCFFAEDVINLLDLNGEKTGIILLTYTKSSRKFWLFLYAGELSDIKNAADSQSIPGKWLEKRKGNLLEKKAKNK